LLIAKLKAGDNPAAYAYDCGPRTNWATLNIEQQASVIEHRFLLARGATVPGDDAFYRRVCPF
jgi:5'-deoxynucleotidase YfbR-like HD superfamily hydrolase